MLKLLAKYWILLIPGIIILTLYFPILSTYFSHDDFFHFNIGRTDGTLRGFLDLFAVKPYIERGYGFYRQLGREALFYIYHSIFGLNAPAFRTFAILLQIINSVLVYTFIFITFKHLSFKTRKNFALFTSVFFAASTANVAVLFYLAGGFQMQMVVFFAFISLFSFRRYILKRDIWMRMIALVSFIAAISSHELGFVIPFLLALQTWMMSEKSVKETVMYVITELLMFWYVLFAYLYIDFFVIGHPQDQAQYEAVFGIKKIANTLMWYVGWAFGLPEMLVDFVTSGFGLDPRLMRFWGNYYLVIFPAFFASLVLLGIIKLKILIKTRKIFLDKYLISFGLWFILSIIPMLILPQHKQTHYLSLALIGFWGAIGYIIFALNKNTKLTLVTLVGLIVLNLVSIQLSKETYPAVQRGRIARVLIEDIKQQYPSLPKGADILVKNDPEYPFIAEDWGGSARQASFVLSNENAMQVLYNDTNLKVYYEGESYDEEIPANGYFFVAKIPL